MKKSARRNFKSRFSLLPACPEFYRRIICSLLFVSSIGGLLIGAYYLVLPKLSSQKVYANNSIGPKTGVRWIDTQADKMDLRDKEVVSKDAYSTHFKNADGTVTALFTGFKQNYEVAPGIWQPIDYSLEKSTDPRYDYQTKNGVGLYLSKNGAITQKNGDSLLESGAPTLGIYNPINNAFIRINNLDNPKVNKTDNLLTLDGDRVKLIINAYDLGAREDLVLEDPSLVDNASLDDLLTLKATISTTSNLTLNGQSLNANNAKYELTTKDSLVLTDNGKTTIFPFPEGHDAKDNSASIRRFLIKEGNTWYLYTSVPVSWLKKLGTSYPVTIDPDFAGTTADGSVSGSGLTYTGARNTADAVGTTQVAGTVGQKLVSVTYTVLRSFLEFTTSSIPDSAVINQVNLTMVMITDNSAVDFTTNVIDYNWNANDPLTTSNMEAAYDGCLAATSDNSWKNSSNVVINTQYASANLSTSWITKDTSYGGSTYYCLSSNKDTNNTAPAGREDINLATADNTNAAYKPFLTITYQPAQVAATAATNVIDTSFSANWNTQSGSGADGYTLDVATDSGFTSFVATGCGGGSCNAKAVGNVTTYSVTGLSANTTYYYRVRATDSVGGGTGVNSSTITVTTLATPVANSATSTLAIDTTSSSAGANVASLSWSHTVSGVNRLLVVGVSKRSYNSVTSVTYNGVALTKSGAVQAGSGDFSRSELWYLVNPPTGTNTIVVTPGGNDWMQTGAISFTGANQITPLGIFASNFGGSGVTSASVNVTSAPGEIVVDALTFWNTTTDATKGASQTLQWSTSSDNAWNGRGSTQSGANSVTMSWTIPSSGAQGWALTAVSIKPNTINENSFTGSWAAVTGATSYKLSVTTNSDCSTSPITSSNCGGGTCNLYNIGNVTQYSITNGLSANTTYYYCLKATFASGDSALSNKVTVLTAPTTPTNVSLQSFNIADSGFFFSYDSMTGASTYNVMVDDNSDFSSPLSSYNPGSVGTAFASVNTGVSAGTTYYYKVASVNSAGSVSSYTSPGTVTTYSSTPTLNAASNVTYKYFQINWSSNPGPTGYYVEVARDSTFNQYIPSFGETADNTPPGMFIPAPTMAVAVDYLLPGTTYYYRVRAQNSTGTSLPVNPAPSIITTPMPTGTAGICNTGTGNVNFTWSCTPATGIDFVSGGNLTIGSGTTFTMPSNYTFVWEPGQKIIINGSIVHATNSKIQQGYPVYPDADGDNYPDSLTPTIMITVPPGYKKPSQLATNGWFTRDCDPALATANRDCTPRKVFYTTTNHDGNFAGVGGADTFCQNQANAAGLYGTYRAWLSNTTTPAPARLTPGPYKYTLVDGTVVANSFAGFSSGSLVNPISKSAAGITTQKNIWTNTTSTGTINDNTLAGTCQNWTDGTSSNTGKIGTNDSATSTWTQLPAQSAYCNNATLALYCIQQ